MIRCADAENARCPACSYLVSIGSADELSTAMSIAKEVVNPGVKAKGGLVDITPQMLERVLEREKLRREKEKKR